MPKLDLYEDAQVAASGQRYLTVVAATTLSETPGD